MLRETLLKLFIPVSFFGYALCVNAAFMNAHVTELLRADFWKQGSAQIERLYSKGQPHHRFARASLGAIRYLLLNEGRRGVVVGSQGWLFTQEDFRAPPDAHQSARIVAEITNIAQTLEQLNHQIVVVFLPAKSEVCSQFLNAAPPGFADHFISEMREAGIKTYAAQADLGRCEQAFFKTDTHWRPEAANAVAQGLADAFPMLSGDIAYTQAAQVEEIFSGDLVSFVTTESLAPFLGLAAEIAPQISVQDRATDAPLALFDAPDSAAHILVGTSYSANPRWGFEASLKLALGHDVYNYALQGHGPFTPMYRYLDQAQGHPSQGVVIWEFPLRYLSDPELLSAGGQE